MTESRCGIECSECEYKESMNCPGCTKIDNPFWGECDVKKCCEAKKHDHCGQCSDFPCGVLNEYSYAGEPDGDDGKRIETCRTWAQGKKQDFDPDKFLSHVMAQDASTLESYFTPDAVICWHETNEAFTVAEYIRANCQYPGDWSHSIRRIEAIDGGMVLVYRITAADAPEFIVTSFIKLDGGKISRMDEYYCMCGSAPAWRQAMNIGKPIADEKPYNHEGW